MINFFIVPPSADC